MSLNLNLRKLAVVLAALTVTSSAFAGEMLLGSATLQSGVDVPVTMLNASCTPNFGPKVASIQLRVFNGTAEIDQFAVRFGNGEYETIPVRETFAAGSTSRVIDLPGGLRCVKEIFLTGSSAGGPDALVEVIGLTPGPAPAPGPITCFARNLRGRQFQASGYWEENVEQRVMDRCYAAGSRACIFEGCR